MTRVISGVVLGAVALSLVWFLSSIALLGVALVVVAMAFHEYDRIVDAIGAKVPYWTTLLATLLVCAMVPFQWVDLESVLAAALLLVALNVLVSPRVGAPLLADTAAAVLAPVYIGVPLGCLVGVHAMVGREGVLLLIATVAVSDTAQYYTGRTLGRTPLAPLPSPKKTREGPIGGLGIPPPLPTGGGPVRAKRRVFAPGGGGREAGQARLDRLEVDGPVHLSGHQRVAHGRRGKRPVAQGDAPSGEACREHARVGGIRARDVHLDRERISVERRIEPEVVHELAVEKR